MMTENDHEQTQTTGRCLCPATWKNPVQNPSSDSKAVELCFKAARSVFLITLRIRAGCGFPWGGKDGSVLCPGTNRSNNFTKILTTNQWVYWVTWSVECVGVGYYGMCESTYITEKPTLKNCCPGPLQVLQGALELVSSPQQLVTLI